MKILNKNKKLKYSKMFIDYSVYEEICKKHDSTIEEHLERLEKIQSDGILLSPSMSDVSIMFEVYTHITKIIKKRR